ncbi:hypothetical protein BZA05DRAFT_396668 [Tricharina praecox]|uniref:uncharacterized protein n=1 Tax=Tricharina praecox TaxID=43433 RepID=UPI00221E6E0B|nr:uncharacterized protein BZA05DRAFT_396668 [Tricharina praecox]KAI5853621.1 hypothetical protein BZA05DRAFT_396668 [Tricharina praecox]
MYRPVQQSSTPPPATAPYGEYFHNSGHATTTTTQLHPADAAQNPLLNEGFEYKSARVASPVSISTTDDGGRKKKKKKASRVGWRPFTIKPPFILFFALVTVGLLCALEYILQRSKRDGALLFSESSYLLDYGPMVVAVLFGLLWASIDHDVKRLEPYFQLSKPGGVTAEHSLLLEYPYCFAAFAPFIALRKRHWVVLSSSFILITILYGVTPVMSTILSRRPVNRTGSFAIERAGIYTPESQPDTLSTAFSYIAFSNQYLNGTLPPFSNEGIAILPFKAMNGSGAASAHTPRVGETWRGSSILYEARLDCTQGVIRTLPDNETEFDFPGRNCRFIPATWHIDAGSNPYFSMLYSRASFEWKLERYSKYDTGSCTGPNNEDMLIGFFGRNVIPVDTFGSYKKMKWLETSAVYCKPVHEQQQVDIVVDANDLSLRNYTRKGEKTPFTGINGTHWAAMLTGQVSSASTADFNVTLLTPVLGPGWGLADHISQFIRRPQFLTLMELYPANTWLTSVGQDFSGNRAQPINVFFDLRQTLTPFGLAKQQDLEALFDGSGKALGDMYSDAYRYIFAMAMASGFTRYPSEAAADGGSSTLVLADGLETAAQREFREDGYVVNERWTRILQGALATVLALSITLAGLVWNRKCELVREPGTIADAMTLLDTGDANSVLQDFHNSEFMSPSQLEKMLHSRGHRYSLRGHKLFAHRGVNDGGINASAHPTINRDQVTLSKSWELNGFLGSAAVVILVGWVALLVTLFLRAKDQSGFAVPSNTFVYDLYASYAPTIAATSFESFLVLLTYQITLLFPFKHLTQGNASAKSTIAVNYDRRPPHLQVFNGVRTRNPLLVVLSVSILLANVLAVAVGGLFYKSAMEFPVPITLALSGSLERLEAYNASSLIRGEYDVPYDAFYVGAGDAMGFERRPWTTDELFYIPFTASTTGQGDQSDNYTTETYGLGATLKCEEIPQDMVSTWYALDLAKNDTDFAGKHRNFEFTTFANTADDVPLLLKSQRDNNRFWRGDDPREDLTGIFFSDNQTTKDVFYEYVPTTYPDELADKKDWGFFGSWHRYGYDPDRRVTINRSFFKENYTGSDSVYDSDIQYLGKTISGPSMFIRSRVGLRCQASPRLVRSKLVSNLAGHIISHTDVELPLSAAMIAAANQTGTGIVGLVNTFSRKVILRVAKKQGGLIDPVAQSPDPGPTNWITFLMHGEARKRNPAFDLYSYPAESARALEAVFMRTFAIYLQLNADEIFPNTTTTPAAAATQQQQGTRFRSVNRVQMYPSAFYVSIVLLLLFIPGVIWTYASLYQGFLAHQPTTLAGVYAAIYASDVDATKAMVRGVDGGTGGARYGYGWFVGGDGARHVGIATEPLVGGAAAGGGGGL